MIKVMVVDDQVLLKETLLFMLEQDEEISGYDGGGDGYEAIENCKRYQPDIVLMDLRMPKLGGMEASERIKELNPSVKVVILTTFEDDEKIYEALELGVDGYIIKDIKPEALLLAVKSSFNDLYVMHQSVAKRLQVKKPKKKYEDTLGIINQYDLSESEINIIKLISDGKSNKELADLLGFTEGTIKNKVSRLFSKLDLKDRTQVVIFAIKNNLI